MLSKQLFLSALQALSPSNASVIHSHMDSLPFPGLPVTSAPTSASYWAAHNRAAGNHLIGYGKNDKLPSQADVVMFVAYQRALMPRNVYTRFAPALGLGLAVQLLHTS
jgi:hypothetical protein